MITGSTLLTTDTFQLPKGETQTGLFRRDSNGDNKMPQPLDNPFAGLLEAIAGGASDSASFGRAQGLGDANSEWFEDDEETDSEVRDSAKRPQRGADQELSISALAMAAAEQLPPRHLAVESPVKGGDSSERSSSSKVGEVTSRDSSVERASTERLQEPKEVELEQGTQKGESSADKSSAVAGDEAAADEDPEWLRDIEVIQNDDGSSGTSNSKDGGMSPDEGKDGSADPKSRGAIEVPGTLASAVPASMVPGTFVPPSGTGMTDGGDGDIADSPAAAVEGTGAAGGVSGRGTRQGVGESMRLGPSPAAEALAMGVAQAGHSEAGDGIDPLLLGEGPNAQQSREPVERSRIIRAIARIEKSLKGLVDTKEAKSVSLRLDPPSLGSMTVEISFRDGELHARLAPELPQVAAVLRERSHELHAALRKMGLSVDQVRVSIESAGRGFDSGSNASSREGGQRGSRQFDGPPDWGAVESESANRELSKQYGVGSIESGWVA
jgi:hypothetical protein